MARRFFVKDNEISILGENINVIGEEIHHINVLRHKKGDTILINEYRILIEELSNDKLLGKIEEISPKPLPGQLFPTGCVWDAWAYVSDLVRSAKNRIILIDNFVDDRVLSMLTKRSDGVSAAIHTRYSEQFLTDLKKHNDQYPKIQFIQLSHRNHDRFLIIDDKVFFMGASLKDMGTGLCAVSEISITPEIILGLLE